MIIIVACFFTVFTPYAVLLFWEGFGGGIVSEQHSFAAMLMAYSNSMIDFWVYALMNVKFRKAVADMLCGKATCYSNDRNSVGTTMYVSKSSRSRILQVSEMTTNETET